MRDGLASSVIQAATSGSRIATVPVYEQAAARPAVAPDHARAAVALADGIVVGSRALEVAENGPAALQTYVRTLREAIDE